ncbi:biotin/lipoyl-binding protein [Candidatus Bipolaricaulota bacterium]|nr:biotin/lipoyl-binding protein [Candidatus Bipolaricaulota bacterium]
MEMEQLREIIKLLKDEGLTEITLSDGDERITVKREVGTTVVAPAATNAPASGPTAPPEEPGTFSLAAPLVGTLFRRLTPEDDPFVSPGDIVSAGDTVCIIEAMKVMNEIKAETSGRVRRVLVEDGDAVEFGQALIVFEAL